MKIFNIITLFTFIILSTYSISVSALPSSFDKEMVMTDQDLYSLPLAFSSADKIQSYLQSQNSILAQIYTDVGFVDYGQNDTLNTDDLILNISNSQQLDSLKPLNQLQIPFGGKKLRPADIIWKVARENFGNSCALSYSNQGILLGVNTGICIDNSVRPINPAFVLAMIQKESSLVYGSCAKPDADWPSSGCSYSDPDSIQKLNFRLDRATGYGCFEVSVEKDKLNSCYDVNSYWKYQKGFFQQVYKSMRMLRLRSEICNLGGYNGYKTGSIVSIDNQPILLKNGITCALYIYTPHLSNDKINLYNNLRFFGADYNLIEVNGISQNYKPKKIIKF
jgi:hypothetical protein